MNLTTTTVLPPPVQHRYSQKLLVREIPRAIHGLFAEPQKLPLGFGKTLRRRRFNPLDRAPVPLGNQGVTPPAQLITAYDIDAKIDWYGTYTRIEDQVNLTNGDGALNKATDLLGQSLRETEDVLARQCLESTASMVNCVHGNNGDNPTNLTREDVNDLIAAMKNVNAEFVTESIGAQNRYGTAPVRDAFWALGHSGLIGQLEKVDGFKSIVEYPSQKNLLESEWGCVSNLRFALSTLGSVEKGASTNGQDVYNIFVVAKNAYQKVELDTVSAQFLYRPPGSGTDAMFQIHEAGYKFAQVFSITNDAWIVKFRCTLG